MKNNIDVNKNKKNIKEADNKKPDIKKETAKEKTDNKEKKSIKGKKESNSDLISIAIVVLVAFLGTYAFLPWHGIISTIPFVIISAFAVTFLKIGKLVKVAAFFLCPFTVSILLNEPISKGMFLSLCCVLFCFFADISVSFYKKKKNVFKLASAVILALSLVLHIFVNSTPWSNIENNKAIKNYVQNNYSDEKLLVSDVHFNSFDRTYIMSMVPETDKSIFLDLVFKDGELVKDEFINYSEKYNMIVGAGKITYTIREKNPNLKFLVESNSIKGYPFYMGEGFHQATTEPLIDYSKYMDFSVYFTSYNSVEQFITLAEECFRALLVSGFCCRNITFYGGIGTRYSAKISVPFNSFVGHLGNYITPYDNGVFQYSFA